MSELDGTIPAPDFPQSLQWLNTGRPISISDLKGKVMRMKSK